MDYGLYIHIPFCVKKCKYCDFISFDNRNDYKDAYISALINEMSEYKGSSCDTVFIGGGTPTSLEDEDLEKLLRAVNDNFVLSGDCEFTAEANPGTVTENKLKLMQKNGVNRLSIGVQSFDDSLLKKIGRIHTGREADNTIDLARKCGFDNISIDLMFALPGQSFESFRETLCHAKAKKPEHISCYSLILEENTPLFKEYESGGLILPSEDTERNMYDYACDFLEKNGYMQYEISNFAASGRESRHNIKYWQCREYIGIGLAAHSYYNGMRYSNTSDLSAYLSGKFHRGDEQILSVEDKVEEFMIMGLRMTNGVSKEEFKDRFGFDIYSLFGNKIERFAKGGFIGENDDRIFLTHKGVAVSNSVMCEFTDVNIKKID